MYAHNTLPSHLTAASSHWLLRFLLAALIVLGARILADGVDVRQRPPFSERHVAFLAHNSGASDADGSIPTPTATSDAAAGSSCTTGAPHRCEVHDAAAWRHAVGSDEVAAAWERLSGAIMQEFIYDAWFSYLSPDREFPVEVRRLLNHAFGEVARRARSPRIDWGAAIIR